MVSQHLMIRAHIDMKLKADFFSDWIKILREVLINQWRYDVSSVPDEEIPFIYLNAKKKQPEKKVRKLVLADTFFCPPEVSIGWEKLKRRIESGEDLTRNLSKKIFKYDYKDSMLNDWDVHHFHLNEKMNGEFDHGTRLLVFALLVDDIFYAIGVFDHDSWANKDIVEVMHRNWPSALAEYKLLGITLEKVSEQERLTLRRKYGNSTLTVNDGTVYGPPGGGVNSAGFNALACTHIEKKKNELKNLEKGLNSQLESLRNTLEKNGYRDESEIEAFLEIRDQQYAARLPKYGILVKLELKS